MFSSTNRRRRCSSSIGHMRACRPSTGSLRITRTHHFQREWMTPRSTSCRSRASLTTRAKPSSRPRRLTGARRRPGRSRADPISSCSARVTGRSLDGSARAIPVVPTSAMSGACAATRISPWRSLDSSDRAWVSTVRRCVHGLAALSFRCRGTHPHHHSHYRT
jgi:hypothetical protein